MLKLYCYTDETGQDTEGKFFLVSIVLSDKDVLDELKDEMIAIEDGTKGKSKWNKTDRKRKELFITEFLKNKKIKNKLYYCVYNNSRAYTPLVAMSIGKAVIHKIRTIKDDYRVNVIIDGLRKSDKEIVRKELKGLDIKYDKIKVNLRDEQDVLLRIADALAGFVRDYLENEKYARDLIDKSELKRVFNEV